MADWFFFNNFKNNVVKWWRLVVLPVFHLDNNHPVKTEPQVKEKQPDNQPEKKAEKDNSDTWWGEAMQNQAVGEKEDLFSVDHYKASSENIDAMEILNRLEEEKKEKERKKQQEIEEARKKAQEQERINAILNKNKVNVDSFIEEGLAGRNGKDGFCAGDDREETDSSDNEKNQEQLRKAQEIIDRLNREAAEDAAKKAQEIERIKEQARKQSGK